jgi:hypothetical protein
LCVDSRCRETLRRTCRGQDCGSHPPTSMAASRKAWSDNGSVAATCPAARSALLQLTDRRRFGRSDTFGRPLRNGRLWPNRRLQRKTPFLRLSPVHRTDLEGQQRVASTHSSPHRRMTAICAKRTFTQPRSLSLSTRLALDPRASRFWLRRSTGNAADDNLLQKIRKLVKLAR